MCTPARYNVGLAPPSDGDLDVLNCTELPPDIRSEERCRHLSFEYELTTSVICGLSLVFGILYTLFGRFSEGPLQALDQLARVTQTIFDGFESKKPQRAILVLLDYARAYDRVWRDALYAKMRRLGVPGCATRWIRALLSDRRARVRWGTSASRWRVFQEGLPQGSVLAPLLWLIYCNDIDDRLRAGDSSPTVSLFADDVALLATGRSLQECADRLQPALDEVSRWVKTWKVQPSPSKCVMTTFTLDPKECGGKVKPQLSFCDHPLGYEETPTFLGLKLDCQLTFAAHIAALREKMAKRRACISAIAGRSYGSHRSTLRIAYKSYVRSLFDYGAVIYFTHAAPAVRERLEVEQRKCARLITGCIKLTDKETLVAEAGLPPLSLRAKELAAGKDITLHWVPGHADLAGNEAADRLANQAAADCAQEEAPIDLSSARTAIRRWTSELASARAQRHPHREPTPSHDELDRWGQATLSQLRTGYCPLVRATAHRLGLVEDPTCRACGEEEEDVEHLLAGCPAHVAARAGFWGHCPTLAEVLSGPAQHIIEFMKRVGRVQVATDSPPPAAP
ncbi:putative RNA-directed DNA polymerase from transposon BS [Amphibalanus amphitrite]|uniref:Putative RNA-directed DNA polymerase from transposon BS n=1 Tax=Amphibalanus amphitrite TaxID=1232801 RepID=A0A6A4X8G8_AMPAM|nr:putative RNA-directed DNA polymerase from transposon BS [Amphibalanus amphitrite]